MAMVLSALAKVAKPMAMMGKTMKTFGKKGVQKSMKNMGLMAKIMKEGIGGQMMDALKGFLDLFKLFAPIFKPLSALIKVFVAEILIQLMPLMMPIMEYLMEFIPAAREAGKQVGVFVKWISENLVPGLVLLGVAMRGLTDGVIKSLTTAWNWIKTLYNNTLGKVWGWIASGFETFVDSVKDFINGFIGIIRSFISVINEIPGVNLDKPAYIHAGIKAVPSTGLYMLKRNEKVLDQQAASSTGGGTTIININFTDSVIADEHSMNMLIDKISLSQSRRGF